MNGMSKPYYELDPTHVDPKRVKKEREAAKKLRLSGWWKQKIAEGICHYCNQKFSPKELTLDHIVPIARGGSSTKSNIVAACRACNQAKHLDTPVDQILRSLSKK